MVLGPQLERAIADAKEADEDLKNKQARKEELDSSFEELAKTSTEVTEAIRRELPALAEWRKADAAMADALAAAGAPDSGTTLERLKITLGELAERMRTIEDTLGPLYSTYVTAREEALAIRNLSTSPT